jgi:DnaD/phage-associated family protein
MKAFSGFPTRTKFTPIPNLFFSTVLPQIDDVAELKVTLHVFWAVYQKRGYPRFVTYRELVGDPELTGGPGTEQARAEQLRRGLNLAVSRGTLLHLPLERAGAIEDVYFVNAEADRRALARIQNGELDLGGLVKSEPYPTAQEQPNIFTLYEQNIGLLSPMVAEELREAEKAYPASWIQDAFKEAVDLNKRSWRYIQRILERWAAEGRDDGEHRRHSEADADPEEYRRRYGHLLKR